MLNSISFWYKICFPGSKSEAMEVYWELSMVGKLLGSRPTLFITISHSVTLPADGHEPIFVCIKLHLSRSGSLF